MTYLAQGNEVSELNARQKLGIGRLSARIWEIKRMGFPVASEFRTVKKATGGKASVKFYWMGDKA